MIMHDDLATTPGTMASGSTSNPPRILIVEDEPVVAMDIERRCKRLGYVVTECVASGEVATSAAALQTPDLVLMDIMLQGEMDGIDTAAAIRTKIDIPVIYLTAHADEETLQRAKITEPFGFIIKPFEDRELATCIQMALYKHAMDERLRRNERWLSTTLRSMGEAVISTDAEGHVRFMNPVAEHLCGLHSGQMLGLPLREALHLRNEETGDDMVNLVENALKERRSFCFKAPALLQASSGERRPVELSASSILGEQLDPRVNGSTFGMVLIFRDVTESRRTEAALKNSVRSLRQIVDQTVAALALTTEKRDPYTAGHQSRVAQLAEAIARDMALPEDQVQAIRVSGLLHDLGKLYIPAEILSKPAQLSLHEMNLMKTHPEAGYDILQSITFPWPVADIVKQHHERMDGTGYPNGLKEDEILPEARIIMVADVVEAMSSHRPYRAALGLEIALAEIEKHQGTRYDPIAVKHCLHLFREKQFVIA